MSKFLLLVGTSLCILTAYANSTGWKVIGGYRASAMSPHGPGARGTTLFRHK